MAYQYGQGQPGGYGVQPQPGYGAPGPGYGAQPPPPAGYGVGGFVSQPMIDPQVQQWFVSVDSDRSGRITAMELQQALVNANWSHFNPESCRLMIGLFDKDMSGTIELPEFQALWNYIQQWKGMFEQLDQNRSGSIDFNELCNAYRQMGYNLSPQFAQTVIAKFDVMGRRSLTLDNFIQSCVMLKSLTDAFRSRDPTGTGTVRMGYEDFLTLAVFNKV